ncbi:MAG: PHP domain-containing protein, partial [Oscillospiraceae bacterium]|nr:PHP domain-containing protein [Oscillospiraceae bacterium]
MSYSNFHSHTTFCDGTETAEGMTLAAIAKGCRALGFSGHAHTEFEVSMSPADTAAYKAELRRLQAAYAGRIELYLGVEQDYFSDLPTEDYDFVIGSVHTLHMPGGDVFADGDAAHQTEAVMRFYGGDWYAFAEDYYALEARVAR